MKGSGSYPYTQDMLDSTTSDSNFMNTIIAGDEYWVYGYDENPTRALITTSLKCFLP
jgi:hypothetical protein